MVAHKAWMTRHMTQSCPLRLGWTAGGDESMRASHRLMVGHPIPLDAVQLLASFQPWSRDACESGQFQMLFTGKEGRALGMVSPTLCQLHSPPA